MLYDWQTSRCVLKTTVHELFTSEGEEGETSHCVLKTTHCCCVRSVYMTVMLLCGCSAVVVCVVAQRSYKAIT
jgi:hypothetical protein